MARIPRQVSRLVTPSGRTGGVAIPSTIIDTSAGIEAQGLSALASGVSDLAQAMSQIKIRENNADDLLAADNVAASIQRTKDNIEQDKIDSPDPKTWGAIADARWSSAFDAVSLQTFHDSDTKDRAFLQFAAEQNHNKATTRLKASAASAKIAVKATRDTLVKAIARGDDVEQEILLHQEALKNVLGDDDLVRIAMEGTVSEGAVSRIATLVGSGQFDAARELAETTSAFDDDPEKRNAAITSINRAARANKTRNEELFDVEAAKIEPNWLQRYRQGDPTLDAEILSWTSGVTDPEIIRKQVDFKEEWLKKLDSKPNKNKTSEVYSAWAAKVDLSPNDLVGGIPLRQAIYAQVGPDPSKDLSITEAESLVTKLEGNLSGQNTISNSLHSNAQKTLSAEFKAGFMGNPDRRGTKEKFNKQALKITQFANDNPTASAKDWKEAIASIKAETKEPFSFSRLLSGILPRTEEAVREGFGRIGKQRDETFKAIPAQAPSVTSFKVGDTQPDRSGQQFIMIKKGATPVEDVWQPIQ